MTETGPKSIYDDGRQGKLFTLYEKLYFQELDRREKLSARLNLPLAVLVAVIGFLSFMLDRAPRDINTIVHFFFWMCFLGACVASAVGAWFFRASWFGHSDKLLPTANATEEYRNELIRFYDEFEEKDALVEAGLMRYLYDYYMKFSSVNTTNNDARSYHLYQATYAITVAALLAFIAFVPYFLTNHGESLSDKNTIEQRPTTATATATSKRQR